MLTNTYGYNPGVLKGFEVVRPSTKLFARLDWNIDESNSLTLRNNYISAYDDNYSTTLTSLRFSDRNYRFNNNQNSTVLELNSSLGDNMNNELIVGYTRIRDFREVTGNPFPAVTIRDASFPGSAIQFGSEEFSILNKLDQDVIEFTDNFTFSPADNHVVTIGTQNEIFHSKIFLFVMLMVLMHLIHMQILQLAAQQLQACLLQDLHSIHNGLLHLPLCN